MNLNADNATAPVVMVVDDSVDSIRMVSDALEAEGLTVLVALEGRQALTIGQTLTPDLVLMDALMPQMDGFETCRRLKALPGLTDTPVIFMTGLSDTEHVVMGLNAGGVDYVTKPIDTTALLARMRVHLANARMARSARAALDSTGQKLFACDLRGETLWATPAVQQRLPAADQPVGERFRESLAGWLQRLPQPGHSLPLTLGDQELAIEFLALVDRREYLLRLHEPQRPDAASEALRQRFELTGRESEVLLWIANGKTNREIGQILDMSPRTVNKHLEQVFRKLGVENRTSAAATAIKCLGSL